MNEAPTISENASQLVGSQGLLDALFPEDERPTVRWLQGLQKKRLIPFVKLGGKVLFDVEEVRAAIRDRHTIAKKK